MKMKETKMKTEENESIGKGCLAQLLFCQPCYRVKTSTRERGDVAELKEHPSGLPLSSCVALRPAPPTSEHVLAEQYDQHGLPVSWYGDGGGEYSHW